MPGKAHPWIQPDPTGFTDGPNLYQYCRNNPLCYRDRLGLSTSHYYTTHDSFEEYFFYHRRDEDKSGGTLFLEAIDYWYGLQISGIEALSGIVCHGRVSFSHGLGRAHGRIAAQMLGLASTAMGLWEISTGLSGLGASVSAEFIGYGVGSIAAVPIAAGSFALIGKGVAEVSAGLILMKNGKGTGEQPPYSGQALGPDPAKCPGEGFEWRGNGIPGSKKGNWFNPKTNECLHGDLNHPPPKKPHWDYDGPNKEKARLNIDGTWEWK